MIRKADNEIAKNREAFFNYEIHETFEAGLSLQGTEVKSLRANGATLRDSYVTITSGEAFMINASIAPYQFGNIHNHEERRSRKLLLHKKEIEKLRKAADIQGFTIVPLAIYEKKGLFKVSIGIARGKKLYDKREAIKTRDENRHIAKTLKEYS